MPTPLKTSQHDMIERHIAGPHLEPRGFKPTQRHGSSLVEKKNSSTQFGTGALSWTKSPRSIIGMMDKTAKNEEQREKGILIEEYD